MRNQPRKPTKREFLGQFGATQPLPPGFELGKPSPLAPSPDPAPPLPLPYTKEALRQIMKDIDSCTPPDKPIEDEDA
jgi:hypothetical protein